MSDPKQVQQRLMRLVREVDGLTWADRKCIGEAIALIDEVRGVDAEPVARLYIDNGGATHVELPDNFKEFVGDVYAHPAPSQPAAPVELPVVAYGFKRRNGTGPYYATHDLQACLWAETPKPRTIDELVKLSDAKAAIRAAQKG